MYKVVDFADTIPVAYKQDEKGTWYAIALPFSLVGYGDTREEAFTVLSEVFTEYIRAVIDARKPVAFYNPSDEEDWQLQDKETFRVTLTLLKPVEIRPQIEMHDLNIYAKRLRRQIDDVELRPAICV